MNAAQADLTVTANNIANTATTGFKGSRAEFAELFSVSPQGVSSNAIGNGVRVSNVAQQFTQGNIDFTDNSLDLALSGQGFFILSDGGALAYTRAGAFQVDYAGLHRERQQQRLQVYPPGANGQLQHRRAVGPAARDERERAGRDDDRRRHVEPAGERDAADGRRRSIRRTSTATTRATSLTVYDSLGAAHTATHVLREDGDPNEWTTQLYVDGNAVGTAQTPGVRQHGRADRRRRAARSRSRRTRRRPAPRTMNMTFDFGATTQYGDAFNVNAITQDGYTTGRLIGIDIDSTGVVQARFTNGRSTRARPGRARELLEPAGPAAARRHELGGDVRLGPGAARPGRQLGLRPGAVRRARSVERRHHRAAGQHDHRAAQLPGERADDLRRRTRSRRRSSTSGKP